MLLIDPEIAIALILIGLILDIWSLFRSLQRNINANGPSGMGGVSLILYCIAALFSREVIPFRGEPFLAYKIANISFLILLHFTLQEWLPAIHYKWLKKRKKLSG